MSYAAGLKVEEAISDSGVDPRCLELSLSEVRLLRDRDCVEDILKIMKQLGVGVSFDDLDSGFGSLELLARVPGGRLRIRPPLMAEVPHDPERVTIVSALIALANVFDLEIVAQGVEDQKQVRFLREMGCDVAQGFWFGNPVSPGDVQECFERGCSCCSGTALDLPRDAAN